MKLTFAIVFFVISMVIISPSNSNAQTSDTLLVSATPPGNLNNVIETDVNANGDRNPNRVYLLQQTGSVDTSYLITSSILSNGDLTIIGKPNPQTGHLPVIEPGILPDGSSPNIIVEPNRSTSKITLKNIYFLGWRTDGVTTALQVANIQADSVTLNVSNCVADGFNGATIAVNSSYDNLFVYNTEFRDAANPGGGPSWVNGAVPIDTIDFENDTFFA